MNNVSLNWTTRLATAKLKISPDLSEGPIKANPVYSIYGKSWNANSQLFARAKSEARMAAHGSKFCTSVSVIFAVLYII